LTFRHGNDNLAEGNFFIGNGKQHTGGIRIINKRNKAINNYFYGLTGSRFRGALVIMNGVPNSALNRYHQVVGGEFLNNSFINCNNIQLCAGSDAERSLPPVDSRIERNVFYHDTLTGIFTIYDDISGISLKENYIAGKLLSPAQLAFEKTDIRPEVNPAGIYIFPDILKGSGCSLEQPTATKDNTGVSWYEQKDEELHFDTGRIIPVEPGLNTLYARITASSPGDILVLTGPGEYKVNKNISINHPLTIRSESTERPVLTTSKAAFFVIENGGSLKLEGLIFDGSSSPDQAGNCIVTTSSYSMNRNYKFLVNNCKIKNLDVNHSFDFFRVFKNTFADSVVIRNSSFEQVTGNILVLDRETDMLGIYNAEYVIIENSTFKNTEGTLVNIVRGGTDESTFGPELSVDRCVFENAGKGSRNKANAALYIHGVQITDISNSTFTGSGAVELYLTNGEPVARIHHCRFIGSDGIKSNSNAYFTEDIIKN
jgi:poly(beta-D-mannuronate) lyase